MRLQAAYDYERPAYAGLFFCGTLRILFRATFAHGFRDRFNYSAMNSASKEVRIWDWPVRLTHWLFVSCLALSWWSAEQRAMDWHRYSGYALLGLLIFTVGGLHRGEPPLVPEAKPVAAAPPADLARGVPEPEQGWVHQDRLLAMLKIEPGHLNISIHRSRGQLGQHGVVDAARARRRVVRAAGTAVVPDLLSSLVHASGIRGDAVDGVRAQFAGFDKRLDGVDQVEAFVFEIVGGGGWEHEQRRPGVAVSDEGHFHV